MKKLLNTSRKKGCTCNSSILDIHSTGKRNPFHEKFPRVGPGRRSLFALPPSRINSAEHEHIEHIPLPPASLPSRGSEYLPDVPRVPAIGPQRPSFRFWRGPFVCPPILIASAIPRRPLLPRTIYYLTKHETRPKNTPITGLSSPVRETSPTTSPPHLHP